MDGAIALGVKGKPFVDNGSRPSACAELQKVIGSDYKPKENRPPQEACLLPLGSVF
jgi:hypothetical protein